MAAGRYRRHANSDADNRKAARTAVFQIFVGARRLGDRIDLVDRYLDRAGPDDLEPVSYTHLTLPTILLV